MVVYKPWKYDLLKIILSFYASCGANRPVVPLHLFWIFKSTEVAKRGLQSNPISASPIHSSIKVQNHIIVTILHLMSTTSGWNNLFFNNNFRISRWSFSATDLNFCASFATEAIKLHNITSPIVDPLHFYYVVLKELTDLNKVLITKSEAQPL